MTCNDLSVNQNNITSVFSCAISKPWLYELQITLFNRALGLNTNPMWTPHYILTGLIKDYLPLHLRDALMQVSEVLIAIFALLILSCITTFTLSQEMRIAQDLSFVSIIFINVFLKVKDMLNNMNNYVMYTFILMQSFPQENLLDINLRIFNNTSISNLL